MHNRSTYAIIILMSILVVLLTACSSNTPPSCSSIADLERLPEAGFLPPESERVRYETGQGASMRESPYSVMVSAVMGSEFDTVSLIRMYDAYLEPQQWVRYDRAADNVRWEKAGMEIEFQGGPPEFFVSPDIRAQKPYRTWYRLTISEPKGTVCAPLP